jgi:2-amino-4-hydroxy-6-hydroxymethyldihydropteridine diphosphokinase
MAKAYLALGTNLGSRLDNLKKALDLLTTNGLISVTDLSPLYETEPVGGPEQGPFLNACTAVETGLPPSLLLLKMLDVEATMGRVRLEHWGPRIMDLDLLVYGNIFMNTPLLELPHPRIIERDFVLIPLSVIAPDLIIPGHHHTVSEILADRKPNSGVRLYRPAGWYK